MRKVDKNHLLFVEGDMYATRFEVFEPFEDPNIACSFHFYPFLFRDLRKGQNLKKNIEQALFKTVSLRDIFERLKRPVWCGETGASFNYGSRTIQENAIGDIIDIYEKLGISWSVWTYKDAGSMGTVYPKRNSKWMTFSKRAKRKWDFWGDFEGRDKYIGEVIKKYPTDVCELEKRKIGLRILANYQLVLKEVYAKILQDIPFKEFLSCAESFDYKNCEVWQAVADMVANHTKLHIS